MSRVLVIPDSHLKIDVIKKGMELANKLMCNRVILLGDYFDDWDAMDTQYEDMAKYLKELLRKNHNRVIPLLGNHELSYLGFPCSGYHRRMEPLVRATIENDARFVWCYVEDAVLYSHAGFTASWIRENKIVPNHIVKYHMGKLNAADTIANGFDKNLKGLHQIAMAGPGRGGHSTPSPVWADMSELIDDNIGKCIQVVGHTPVSEIEFLNNCYFTDVYSNDNISDEYLYVVDGEPKIVHYNELILGEI